MSETADLETRLTALTARVEAIEAVLGLGPLRPGETRHYPGGNSAHLHTGPDCPCTTTWGGGAGGPTTYTPLEGPSR